MQNGRIAIGIIGCGTISGVYLENLTKHFKNIEVLACADMFAEKAQQTKEKFQLPKACSVEDLLADPSIDLVANLTNPAAHHEINMKALQAGKNVYCEKPMALNLAEANEQVALAKKKGLFVGSAPDTFLGAGLQTCRKLLDEGAIGTPVGFTANMVCGGHELWHPAPVFYYKKGGGPMLDMGPYYIAALVMLLGPIKRVSCFARATRKERMIQGKSVEVEVPTHYVGIVEFECGAVGNINMSFDVWNSKLPLMELYGTTGSMMVPDPNLFGGDVAVFDGNKLTKLVGEVEGPFFNRLKKMITSVDECTINERLAFPVDVDPRCNMRGLGLSDIASSLLNHRKSRLSPEMSRHVVEALTAFEISSDENKPYVMTTSCERPNPMPEKANLWEVD